MLQKTGHDDSGKHFLVGNVACGKAQPSLFASVKIAMLTQTSMRPNGDRPNPLSGKLDAQPGISEAERIAARIGKGIARLRPDWIALLETLPRLGRVRIETSNTCAVLLQSGVYPAVRTSTALRALNPIDLKINLSFWASAFVVMEQNDFDPRVVRSIRFYGRDGAMIHKLRLTPASSVPVFEEILEEFVSLDQSRQQRVDRAFSPQPAEFLPMNNWRERNEATFLNAPHSAWEPFALRLSMQSADRLFRRLMVDQIPVTVTVANAGCVQTRSGLFERIFNANRCVNIKAHSMNLHFSERSMARGWIVRSADGHTESLELYDQRQRLVASISPWRAAGPRVDRRWREALAQLCEQACAA